MGNDTYYDILGVSPSAPPAEIKAKYRELIRQVHPDRNGPVALFRQVQEAYDVLSNPRRRAAYDRSRTATGAARASSHREAGASSKQRAPRRPGQRRSSGPAASRGHGRSPQRPAASDTNLSALIRRNPAGAVAVAGAGLLVVGAAIGADGRAVVVLGCAVLILAIVAGLGSRGTRECEAFERSGMAAVDTMTGRQFEALLRHLFADQGYRVARFGVRTEHGGDLLLQDARGRTVVQVRHWRGVVHQDAVQQAARAKTRYGVGRALLVTSAEYSPAAVTVARSHGVTLWNRSALASELSTFRREAPRSGADRLASDVRAGYRMCAGFAATLLLVVVTAAASARKRLTPRP